MDYDAFVKRALGFVGKISKDYLTNKQILMEYYETEYGIHDHVHASSPLSGVKYNQCEDTVNHYLYDSYLELFLYKGIGKHTGLTFDEFIDRPRYEIEKIAKAVDAFKKKEAQAGNDALEQLKNSTK